MTSEKGIYTIYRITNQLDGKSYVGFTSTNVNQRRREHINSSRDKKKVGKQLITRALRKYGPENFVWEILYQSKDGIHTLKQMEPFFIREHNTMMPNGYNMNLGGDDVSAKEHVKTKEFREHMSKVHHNKITSNETKQRMSQAKRGENNPMFGVKNHDCAPKKCVIDSIEYSSLANAAKSLDTSIYYIRKMIKTDTTEQTEVVLPRPEQYTDQQSS